MEHMKEFEGKLANTSSPEKQRWSEKSHNEAFRSKSISIQHSTSIHEVEVCLKRK